MNDKLGYIRQQYTKVTKLNKMWTLLLTLVLFEFGRPNEATILCNETETGTPKQCDWCQIIETIDSNTTIKRTEMCVDAECTIGINKDFKTNYTKKFTCCFNNECQSANEENSLEGILPDYNRWCPYRYTYYAGYCYRTYEYMRLNFDAAERYCRRINNGHLASFHRIDEIKYLRRRNLLKTKVWIGLNDRRNEGSLQWTDRSSINFMYFRKGEPNNYGGHEDCVEMYPTGKWNDIPCRTKRPFMCKIIPTW